MRDAGSTFDSDLAWYQAHRAELARTYRGQYVAIINRQVVDADADFSALAKRVFARFGQRSVLIQKATPTEPVVRL